MGLRRGLGVLVPATMLLMTHPGRAHAHPLVDEGRRLYEEAQFDASLDAFARAARADDLTVADLADLFATRALVHLATDNDGPMTTDLERLAAVAPDYELDPRVPPDMRRVFTEVRARSPGPLRLRATPASSGAGVTIEARIERDPNGLVREVRVHGRPEGEAGWDTASDAPLLVRVSPGDIVEYHAEAIGPGGAVLATSGSAESPLRAGADADDADGPILGPTDEADDDGGAPWLWIGVGGAVAVGAAVVAVLLLGSGGDPDTDVEPFTVGF